jgi:ABC-type nitrate/sulfonate/bicarbonate transport system ATPase subunit
MATLELDEVSKINGDETVAVDHVRLDIEDCEFVVLGPSGCGTTTALAFADGSPGSRPPQQFFVQRALSHRRPQRDTVQRSLIGGRRSGGLRGATRNQP